MEMSTEHKTRIADEYRELEERHVKLRSFMETNIFEQLDNKNKYLLVKQEMAMGLYRNILWARMEANNISLHIS